MLRVPSMNKKRSLVRLLQAHVTVPKVFCDSTPGIYIMNINPFCILIALLDLHEITSMFLHVHVCYLAKKSHICMYFHHLVPTFIPHVLKFSQTMYMYMYVYVDDTPL